MAIQTGGFKRNLLDCKLKVGDPNKKSICCPYNWNWGLLAKRNLYNTVFFVPIDPDPSR
jgi:hypothetical protein